MDRNEQITQALTRVSLASAGAPDRMAADALVAVGRVAGAYRRGVLDGRVFADNVDKLVTALHAAGARQRPRGTVRLGRVRGVIPLRRAY